MKHNRVAISKAESKRKAATKRREREATKRDRVYTKAANAVGAFGGQKFFAGMTTPGTDSFPIQYAAGGLALLLGMRKTTGAGAQRLFDLAEGAALGQLGVMGFQASTPLFSDTGS